MCIRDSSSGGLWHAQKIPVAPLYHVPFAETVKQAVGIPVVTVGLITCLLYTSRCV